MVEFNEISIKLAKLLKLAGLNLLEENYQPTRLTLFIGLCLLYSHLGSWCFFYAVWPNIELIVKLLSTYGVFCQMLVKYLSLLKGHETVQRLLKKILALHQSNARKSPERVQPQIRCTKLVLSLINFMTILYTVSACIIMIVPLLIFFFNDQFILPFCVVQPFVDQSALIGHFMNYFIQCFIMYAAVLIECSFDIILVLFIIFTINFVDHFKMDLDEFAEFLAEEGCKDLKEVKSKLKKIHQSHLEIIE